MITTCNLRCWQARQASQEVEYVSGGVEYQEDERGPSQAKISFITKVLAFVVDVINLFVIAAAAKAAAKSHALR